MGDDNATLVDLFAGCGGLGLGFHQAGFKTILANELHIDPATTYCENLLRNSKEAMIVGRMETVLKNKDIENLGLEVGEVTCVTGGPPCQGFSMAGRGNPDDPRNSLFKEYLRVVRKIRPKAILFENVPGFANRYGIGLRKHLIKSLKRMGYITDYGVLQATDFGVPQLRKRFFCFGVHKDHLAGDSVSLPQPTWSQRDVRTKLTARKVLDDLDTYQKRGGYGTGVIDGPERYLSGATTQFQKEMRAESGKTTRGHTWNTRIPQHTERVRRRMGEMQKGSKSDSFVGTDLETSKLSQRVLSADLVPRITVVSIPDDYIHYNREMPRTLSVRECARLQTFPDHFRFFGKRTTGGKRRRYDVPQYTQVANAIPPRLARVMAEQILRLLI
jgi:DNA (cytosine-5)-methyltransferase 1